jgi:hypothetical protein
VTPAAAIFGNHSAWFLKALADELTPQGVAAGGSDRAGAGRTVMAPTIRERWMTPIRIRVLFMNNVPESNAHGVFVLFAKLISERSQGARI